jgi:hypothetical protein
MRRLVVPLALAVAAVTAAGCTATPAPPVSASAPVVAPSPAASTSASPTVSAPIPAIPPSPSETASAPAVGQTFTPGAMAARIGGAMAAIRTVTMSSEIVSTVGGLGASDTSTVLDWTDPTTPRADNITDDEAGLTHTIQIGDDRYVSVDEGPWQRDAADFGFPTTLGPTYWQGLFDTCATDSIAYAGTDTLAGVSADRYTATALDSAGDVTLGGLWLDASGRVVQLATLTFFVNDTATTEIYTFADFDEPTSISAPD